MRYSFIISAHMLNKSYGLTRPGTSLMRCSFTKNKRHVISMKSITFKTTCTHTTHTSRIFHFSTRTSEEYWTCLM